MNNKIFTMLGVLTALLILVGCSDGSVPSKAVDRSVLPIQPPAHEPITELDARDATAPPRFEVKAPEDAPNVLHRPVEIATQSSHSLFRLRLLT